MMGVIEVLVAFNGLPTYIAEPKWDRLSRGHEFCKNATAITHHISRRQAVHVILRTSEGKSSFSFSLIMLISYGH